MVKIYTNQSGSKPYPMGWSLQYAFYKGVAQRQEYEYLKVTNVKFIRRSIKVGIASQYITADTIHQRCLHLPWVDHKKNLHSY